MQPTASIPECENRANETLDSQDAHLPCVSFRMPSTPGSFTHANLPKPKHHSTSSETYGAHLLQTAAACGQSHREMTCQRLVQGPWEVCQDCSLALGPCNGHTQSSSALQASSQYHETPAITNSPHTQPTSTKTPHRPAGFSMPWTLLWPCP